MADTTGIEWTDSTWNPVTGCTEVTPGCDRCYAKTFAERWRGTPGHYFEHGFDVELRPDKLEQPLHWRRPRRIFVNSMSDLFHDQVPDEFIRDVFAVMAASPRHTFQLLTKRHGRMRSLLSDRKFQLRVRAKTPYYALNPYMKTWDVFPLPNVWLGVSAEDQKRADLRIPALLDTPAAVRFVSAEPLLGPIDFSRISRERCGCGCVDCRDNAHCGQKPCIVTRVQRAPGLDWVIVGGESGHGARPMHPRWAELIQRECETAGVPFLFKQWGEWTPLAPTDADGRFNFRNGVTMTDDGNTYGPGDLVYPDGPLRGEAIRADFPHHNPTSMYRTGKRRAGRELYHDGRTWDEFPTVVAHV